MLRHGTTEYQLHRSYSLTLQWAAVELCPPCIQYKSSTQLIWVSAGSPSSSSVRHKVVANAADTI